MFKHKKTGVIYKCRLDAIIVMGTARYRKALKNLEFEFDYTLLEGEQPIKVYNYKEK